eukprot:TRINITY_DN3955_c0_g1_i4.p1 TRINITY_DN3955_c0_g1~~TRINITY_DN3955_c0_g1_i4.p1  ORF type:complete len:313 (-),score=43.58 TRINITY_DN3955_c0_g1_i4:82-1020(-)
MPLAPGLIRFYPSPEMYFTGWGLESSVPAGMIYALMGCPPLLQLWYSWLPQPESPGPSVASPLSVFSGIPNTTTTNSKAIVENNPVNNYLLYVNRGTISETDTKEHVNHHPVPANGALAMNNNANYIPNSVSAPTTSANTSTSITSRSVHQQVEHPVHNVFHGEKNFSDTFLTLPVDTHSEMTTGGTPHHHHHQQQGSHHDIFSSPHAYTPDPFASYESKMHMYPSPSFQDLDYFHPIFEDRSFSSEDDTWTGGTAGMMGGNPCGIRVSDLADPQRKRTHDMVSEKDDSHPDDQKLFTTKRQKLSLFETIEL